jgi:hypothetical protein
MVIVSRPAIDREAPAAVARELSPGERRIAASRAALAAILSQGSPRAFPRSQTMRFLMGGKGKTVALGALAGLLAVKPKFALSLLRLLPLGRLLPVARILQSLR